MTQINNLESIERVFFAVADMKLTKKQRSQIAQLIMTAMIAATQAAENNDSSEALNKASFMAMECSK